MTSLKPSPGERWTDKFGLGRDYVSLEDTVSPEFFALEREAIFRRSWLFVGRDMMVPRPGDFFTKEIEVLKSSIIVTRDSERRVRVFHNVCPHRGNKLAWETHADREISGHCKRFVCKFHGIAFTPDGKLALLTDSKSWLEGQGDRLRLAEVPFDIWNGFIFVNLDHGGPKETLREYLGEHLWNGFDGYPFDQMTERYSMVAHAKANWKGMIDGFSEIYHAGTTHAEPFKGSPMDDSSSFPIDYFGMLGRHYQYVTRRYPPTHTNFEYERVTQGFGTGPRYPFGVQIDKLPRGADPLQLDDWGTSSNTIFPNTFIQIYHPGYLVTYGMWPLAYDQMRFEMHIYMTRSRNFSELLSHKASVSMFLEAALQDFSLLEAQQAGLETRAFNAYPLTDEEVCVRHFHQQIQRAVAEFQAAPAQRAEKRAAGD
jgi:phenylpropionate dioxygenase-like ring-hydroxylating dioxygenase large terminal subunit